DAGARDQRGRPLAEDPHHRRAAGGDAGARRGRGRPLVDDKRRRILDAALRVFAARGYHGTSVPEVAETAKVGVGTLYRYFEDKNALVNEVYRDAKQRLKDALLDGLAAPDVYQLDNAEHWFSELWRRLATFARAEPDAFRFLEMQDHVEYLDAKSRALELSVLAPLWLAGKRLRDRSGGPPVDIAIALLWGAFVGLVKASRLGYLELDDRKLEQAGEAAWRIVAPTVPRASDERTRKAPTVPRASDERTRRAPTVSRASDDRTRRAPTVSRASDDRERATRSDSRRHSRRSLYDPKG
ncbi:MAG TPA: TetR/AcrR family transcriptional regulator, partial [Kofleriaceae bacterium]|nr:TetR/AcrR family transcriptional regulator [Kofleriaceae bacterium]